MCRYDWILTIVLSVVVPLYLLSGWLHAKASVGFAQIRRQALQEATEVSLELLTKVLEQYNIMLMPNLSLICCRLLSNQWRISRQSLHLVWSKECTRTTNRRSRNPQGEK